MVRSQMMGARIRRKEDPRLITGSSMYVGDLQLMGMLHASFLRSPYAHARIRSIDTSAARDMPGVYGVYTNEEMLKLAEPLGGEGMSGDADIEIEEDIPVPGTHTLAQDKVRWVGEPIAVVLADSEELGQDAAEAIEVDYEILPAVVDYEKATEDGAPLVWDHVANNIGMAHQRSSGDVEGAFSSADITISQRILSQRLVPLAMEGRAIAAAPDPLPVG